MTSSASSAIGTLRVSRGSTDAPGRRRVVGEVVEALVLAFDCTVAELGIATSAEDGAVHAIRETNDSSRLGVTRVDVAALAPAPSRRSFSSAVREALSAPSGEQGFRMLHAALSEAPAIVRSSPLASYFLRNEADSFRISSERGVGRYSVASLRDDETVARHALAIMEDLAAVPTDTVCPSCKADVLYRVRSLSIEGQFVACRNCLFALDSSGKVLELPDAVPPLRENDR